MQPTDQSLCSKGHGANSAGSLTLFPLPGPICYNLILIDDLAGVSRPPLCNGHLSASSLPSAPEVGGIYRRLQAEPSSRRCTGGWGDLRISIMVRISIMAEEREEAERASSQQPSRCEKTSCLHPEE